MGVILELARAKQRIKDLESQIVSLEAQLSLGKERPSPPDIIKPEGIIRNGSLITIDTTKTHIPFTQDCQILPIDDIPDSNSMDAIFDKGNNNLYLIPADEENHKIMVDWIAEQWIMSGGLLAADCVYRIMANEDDDPGDFTKQAIFYAIHRLINVSIDDKGRQFIFKGVNNEYADPYPAHDKNILFLNIGVIY